MQDVCGKEMHIHPDTQYPVHTNPEAIRVLPLISEVTGFSPHAFINLAQFCMKARNSFIHIFL